MENYPQPHARGGDAVEVMRAKPQTSTSCKYFKMQNSIETLINNSCKHSAENQQHPLYMWRLAVEEKSAESLFKISKMPFHFHALFIKFAFHIGWGLTECGIGGGKFASFSHTSLLFSSYILQNSTYSCRYVILWLFINSGLYEYFIFNWYGNFYFVTNKILIRSRLKKDLFILRIYRSLDSLTH